MNKKMKMTAISALALVMAILPNRSNLVSASVQTPKSEILNQLNTIEHKEYSRINFIINSKYSGESVLNQLSVLKTTTKPVTLSVYVKSESDLLNNLQKGLDSAKTSKYPIIVSVPKGNYKVTTSLHIYSNTWLRLQDGAEMIRSVNKSFPFIMNGDSNASYYLYNGQSNIIIDGGVWNSNSNALGTGATTFNIAHGQNIIVQNLTIENVYDGHAIDFTADKNVLVRKNHFMGYKDTDGLHNYVEAIQVDGFISEKAFHSFGTVDHTLTTNVIIESNVFGKNSVSGLGAWAVGVGSHSAAYKEPYENIYINDNTFSGQSMAAIKAHNWSNVQIYRNEFKDVQKGVWLDVTKDSIDRKDLRHSELLNMDNFVIKNNVFRGTRTVNIDTDGSASKYITNLNIGNNNIHKVIIPNTQFWQVASLVIEYKIKGYDYAYGRALKTYGPNEQPKSSDPYWFVVETNGDSAVKVMNELKARGYALTYIQEVK